MTDKEHADIIWQIADQLNSAVTNALNAGLRVDLEIDTHPQITALRYEHPYVKVQILRELK